VFAHHEVDLPQQIAKADELPDCLAESPYAFAGSIVARVAGELNRLERNRLQADADDLH